MSDIKWIKITTDIFDDEKIMLIESLPDADSIIVIWFKLLCLAGKQNNSGVFLMNDRIPYTDKMLAAIFRRKEATVQLALQTFEQFGMIEVIDGVITIPKWGKHQTLDALEKRNEYMRNYMSAYREKQKQITGKVNSKVNSKANVNCLEGEGEGEEDIIINADAFICPSEKIASDKTAEKNAEINEPKANVEALILNDGSEWTPTKAQVEEYVRLYPNVDIEQQFRNMRGWCIGNPSKRKTKKGIKRFVTTWLSREQDRGGNRSAVRQTDNGQDWLKQFIRNNEGGTDGQS